MATGSVGTGPARVVHWLEQLVRATVVFPAADATDSARPAHAEKERQLVQLCLKILDSRLQPTIVDDDFAVSELIKRKLARAKRADDAARFADLYRRLSASTVLQQRWSILYLLHALSGDGQPKEFAMVPTGLAAVTSTALTPAPSALEPVRSAGVTHAAPVVQEPAPGAAQPPTTTPSSTSAAEAALIRDLIFVLDGADGRAVKLSARADQYVVENTTGLSAAQCALAERLAECGWLARRVAQFAEAPPAAGLVAQALCAALRDELAEYRRLVAALDAQRAQLTLRRMAVWLAEPQQRLRTLAVLCDAAHGKQGGALLDALDQYTRHGGRHAVVAAIVQRAAQPLLEMLRKWVCEGALQDPFGEFFVAAADAAVRPDELWQRSYALRPGMLPSFVGTELAAKVLLTGKSINFVRFTCNDHVWVLDSATNAAWPSDLRYNDQAALDAAVSSAATSINRRVIELLFDTYHFRAHVSAIKRYLLLGQGDFVQVLMDNASEELAKPAASVLPHHLAALLAAAVRGSNAQYDDPELVGRLDVRKLQAAPGDLGWDVFSLDYHVDGPIRTVLTPEVMHKYLTLSNFLIRLRRVEHTLSFCWQRQMSARSLYQLPAVRPVLHRYHLLRAEMIQFINTLQYYVMFEVLETSWQELDKALDKAAGLNDVLAAHTEYIAAVERRAMLSRAGAPLLAALHRIFESVLRFRELQNALVAAGMEAMHRRSLRVRESQERAAAGRWAAEHDDSADDGTVQAAATAAAQLAELTRTYRGQVLAFREVAAAQDDPCFRFIAFRLDFNEYYD